MNWELYYYHIICIRVRKCSVHLIKGLCAAAAALHFKWVGNTRKFCALTTLPGSVVRAVSAHCCVFFQLEKCTKWVQKAARFAERCNWILWKWWKLLLKFHSPHSSWNFICTIVFFLFSWNSWSGLIWIVVHSVLHTLKPNADKCTQIYATWNKDMRARFCGVTATSTPAMIIIM